MRQLTILVLMVVLAACSESQPAAKPSAEPDKPLQGTVLQAQGEALQRAKEVEATINQADQQRRAELDAAE